MCPDPPEVPTVTPPKPPLEIPPEIFAILSTFSDRPSQKNLRLTSRLGNAAGTRDLFRCINVKVNWPSFSHLGSIAFSEHLSHHVVEVCYNGRLLRPDLEKYDTWRQNIGFGFMILRSSFDDESPQIIPTDEWASSLDLQEYHRGYLRLLHEQENLLRAGTETHFLSQAFERLPRLSRITFDYGKVFPHPITHEKLLQSGSEWTSQVQPPGWDISDVLREIGHVASETLIRPAAVLVDDEESKDETVERFGALVHAVHMSRSNIDILDAGYVNCNMLSDVMESPWADSFRRMLSNITALKLGFIPCDGWEPSDEEDGLENVVTHANQLQTLELHGRPTLAISHRSWCVFDLSATLKSTMPQAWLRRVELGNLEVEEEAFKRFLDSYSASLTEVKLSNLRIHHTFEPRPTDYFWEDDIGYWARVFIHMAGQLTLRSVELEGAFTNGWSESYEIKPGKCLDPACVKQKVLQYTVRQGVCPFNDVSGDDDRRFRRDEHGKWLYDIPWQIETDECWQIDESRLKDLREISL